MNILDSFIWSVGEEASDPWVTNDQEKYRINQLELSNHLNNQDTDLKSVADLGIRYFRYGMPWKDIETQPGVYDWQLWDRAFEACRRNQLTPIVDLLHFGLPDFCDGFANPKWIDHFIRYTEAFLNRYPEIRYYTPINEPCWTAITAGHLGIWNDQKSTPVDFVAILANLTLANLEAIHRIQKHPENWWISAETFNIQIATDPAMQPQADQFKALGWLVWDWHFGITPPDCIAELVATVDPETLARIKALKVNERVLAGHDFYPSGIHFHGEQSTPPSIETLFEYYKREATEWYQRYQQPFWISETSNFTLPVEQQIEWLDSFIQAIDELRANQVPVNGFCWYSRQDQHDWDTLLVNPTGRVTICGLFDSARKARPVADRFKHHVTQCRRKQLKMIGNRL